MKETFRIPRIKTGDKVFWLDPAREKDGDQCCREYEVTERKAGMLLLDDRIEALHKECYLKSEYCCPICGRPLYYEKSYNTSKKYPLVCLACDENFFFCECDKDLSYGHIAMLEGILDNYFVIAPDHPEDYDDLRSQASVTFESGWRDGSITGVQDFYDTYGGDHNQLYLKDDIWYKGLSDENKFYAATMGKPQNAVNWTPEGRDNQWDAMDVDEKREIRVQMEDEGRVPKE